MEKLLCSQCGSNEFILNDSIHVCKYCGTQYYSQLDALQIEKKQKVSSIIKNADTALFIEDYDRAAKYYEKIIDIEPNNIEMLFFMSFCKFKKSLQGLIKPLERKNLANVLINSFKLIEKNYDYGCKDSVESIAKISKYILDLYTCNFYFHTFPDGTNNAKQTSDLITMVAIKFVYMVENIINSYNVNEQSINHIYALNEVNFTMTTALRNVPAVMDTKKISQLRKNNFKVFGITTDAFIKAKDSFSFILNGKNRVQNNNSTNKMKSIDSPINHPIRTIIALYIGYKILKFLFF